MKTLTRPIFEINLKKIVKNYNSIKSYAKGSITSAVLKNDAYGFGAEIIAKTLYEQANCLNFFIAHAFEGKDVRKHCENANIFVLQGIGDDSLEDYKKYNLTPVINTFSQFVFWKNNKQNNNKPILNIDTGLNRLGFREDELKKLSSEDIEHFSFIMSHLASADNIKSEYNQFQLNNFNNLRNKYCPNIKASLGASDGTMLGTNFHFDMIRVGAGLYGIERVKYTNAIVENVSKITAPIIEISNIKKGEAVGYSNTFIAKENMTIANISIGYGDGLPRDLSNKGEVIINGKKAKILGRVSMDNVVCDISEIKTAKINTLAEIINDEYDMDNMAKDIETVAHEVASNFGKNKRFIKKYN